jgi:uncharacterized integral membrane protein (TIGR00698 family)
MTIVLGNPSSLIPAERTTTTPDRHLPSSLSYLPGMALAGGIATVAFVVRNIDGMAVFSPMILAIVIGMAFHNIVGTPSLARRGIAFSLRRLLRAAIVLLGFQLTASQIASVGSRGLLIVALSLRARFAFTVWIGRALEVDRKLTELIAAGTSICGASAIIATNTVTEAHDEDVAYAIACVTIFGSIAMFAYPVLPGLLHLDSQAYGLWSGASILEIAQAVATSFQNGQRAGEIGTMVKLARVMLLAPVVFALSMRSRISALGTRRFGKNRETTGPVVRHRLRHPRRREQPHRNSCRCQKSHRCTDNFSAYGRPRRDGARDRYLEALRERTPTRRTGRAGLPLDRDLQLHTHQTHRLIRS